MVFARYELLTWDHQQFFRHCRNPWLVPCSKKRWFQFCWIIVMLHTESERLLHFSQKWIKLISCGDSLLVFEKENKRCLCFMGRIGLCTFDINNQILSSWIWPRLNIFEHPGRRDLWSKSDGAWDCWNFVHIMHVHTLHEYLHGNAVKKPV